jgi:hypothetical protein
MEAYVAKQIAAKPEIVQISTAYGKQQGSKLLPRNQYTAIRDEKTKSKEEAKLPKPGRCQAEGGTGETAQGASHREHHGHSLPEGNW